jgi:hypothetical protein
MHSVAVGKKTCANGTGISAAVSFLELRADEKWPFEQFRKALKDPGMEGTKPEGRW